MVTLPLAAAFREASRAPFAPTSLYEQRFWVFFHPSMCPHGMSAYRVHGFGRLLLQNVISSPAPGAVVPDAVYATATTALECPLIVSTDADRSWCTG
jgi:hypothetical protein